MTYAEPFCSLEEEDIDYAELISRLDWQRNPSLPIVPRIIPVKSPLLWWCPGHSFILVLLPLPVALLRGSASEPDRSNLVQELHRRYGKEEGHSFRHPDK